MTRNAGVQDERLRHEQLARALERAGLELVRRPEGWCAIRIKPAEPVEVTRAGRRGLRRRVG